MIPNSNYSQRQLYTIKTFGTEEMVGPTNMCVHVGCMGCGKTRSLVEAFGLYCANLKSLGIEGLNFVVAGRTKELIQRSVGNVLTNLFGSDFKYDGSRVNGIVKDAILFGQVIYFIGFNDNTSENKFRGITDIMGVLHDEAVLCTREQFDLIMARLRGVELDEDLERKLPKNYVRNWYIGSTNPDSPTHFLKKYIDDGTVKMIQWYASEVRWEGFKRYFTRQKKLFKDIKSNWERFILGRWAASDNMVYPMFYYKTHVLDGVEKIDYGEFKRTFLAIDYGSNHPTTILTISLSYTGEYIISEELVLKRTAVSDIIEEIAKIFMRFKNMGIGLSTIYIDPSAVALKDEFVKQKISYTPALNSHQEGIGCIRNMLSLNKLFITSNCEGLIGEMYSYVFKNSSSGKDEVVKVNDDLVDALRYGVYTDSVVGR